MASIEIDESPPAKSITFGQTLLRSVVGLILVAHGAQKFMQVGSFADALVERFGNMDAQGLAYTVAGIELAAGVGLVLGWFTRLSAFVLVAASALAFVMAYVGFGGTAQDSYELALVLATAGSLFVIAGGGPLSMDTALRERRRRKAIQNDEIWSRPPYVGTAHHATD
jgi:putative oxidoreductase